MSYRIIRTEFRRCWWLCFWNSLLAASITLPLQVRKGKKHIAEYKADKPLCGTWAEIDGQIATLGHLAISDIASSISELT